MTKIRQRQQDELIAERLQVSLPLATLHGCPLGVSLVAAPGADALLLALARRISG